VALLSWPAGHARAHPLSPAAVLLRETAPSEYQVTFRRPEQLASHIQLQLPSECTRSPRGERREGDQRVSEQSLVCEASLEGKTVRVLGLTEVELSALVYVEFVDGESARELLAPHRTSFVVPKRTTALAVLRDYVALGAEHLVTGYDHLLFVLGLMLLVSGTRARLLALTSFTLGHSVTLCLAALSLLTLPQAPVELGIAASLIVLALEILERRDKPTRSASAPIMAGAFGLLHGLGFAGALSEAGLPDHAIPLSLLGFNLGIELAQIAVLLALAPLLLFARKIPATRLRSLHAPLAYAIGALAAMWFLERLGDGFR
jgi:hydrogenase/urease accessory protein HupE